MLCTARGAARFAFLLLCGAMMILFTADPSNRRSYLSNTQLGRYPSANESSSNSSSCSSSRSKFSNEIASGILKEPPSSGAGDVAVLPKGDDSDNSKDSWVQEAIELREQPAVNGTKNFSRCFHHRTLYVGHSHVHQQQLPHCFLAGYDCRQSGSKKYPTWMKSDNVYRFGIPYLEHKAIKFKIKESGIFNRRPLNTIVLGTWAWHAVFENSHPTVVYQKVFKAMTLLLGYQRRAFGGLVTPLKFLVMLPHSHRGMAWEMRAVCATDKRLEAYSQACETAAFDFRAALSEAEAKLVDVLVIDIFNWSKGFRNPSSKYFINEKVENPFPITPDHPYSPSLEAGAPWSDGGDSVVLSDGHLRPARKRDITLALFERGLICDTNEPRLRGPKALSAAVNPDFVRVPRKTHGFLQDIERGAFRDENPDLPPHLPQPLPQAMIDWPPRPSCEAFTPSSKWFWGNILTIWDVFALRKTISDILYNYNRFKIPRSDRLRYQVLSVAQNAANISDFVHARFSLMECLNSVGLSQNATRWDTGTAAELRGNVEYILWQRRPRLMVAAGNDSSLSLEINNASTTLTDAELARFKKRKLLQMTKELPPTPIPTCVCVNSTHLLPDVHSAMLKRATDAAPVINSEDRGSSSNKSNSGGGKNNNNSGAGMGSDSQMPPPPLSVEETKAAIAAHCTQALSHFDEEKHRKAV